MLERQSGNVAEAIDALKKAQEIDPDNPMIQQALEQLQAAQ